MTKVLKWLGGGLAVAMLLGAVGLYGSETAQAQSPPTPPARFVGTVAIDGVAAGAGTAIVAKIGDVTCATTSVFTAGGESRYAIDVPASEPTNSPDCGAEGSSVSFYVDGKKADQSGEWKNFDLNVLNLTVTTPPTPAPPDTGTGVTSSTSSTTLPLAAVLGIATLVLGLGGLALSRRR